MIYSLNPNKDKLEDINYRYVYFNDDGLITGIAPRFRDDLPGTYALFEFDDIEDFIKGKLRFSEYVVSRTKTPLEYTINKKKVNYKSRSLDNQLLKIDTCEKADIVVSYKNGILTFESSDSVVKNSGVTFGQEVTVSGSNVHPFFVTVNNRPDFILETVLVSFSDLMVGEKVEVKLDMPYKDIGLYSRHYFNSYSLEIAE